MPPLVSSSRDVLHSQSYGCWLAIHVGFTMVYFSGPWKNWQGIRVNIGSPHHDPNTGYHCTRWGIGRWSFNVPRLLSLGTYAAVLFACLLCAAPVAEAAPCRGGSCGRAEVRVPGKVVKAKPARRLGAKILDAVTPRR